ncbi:acyl-CoA dehydrogenase [Streptomyces noursei ATCC 11455]|uniref:acyl-CoA dehydrogenase family protein n=1 Tax=Streptomyces noursei TaxID=1971 RepID=UPI00081C7820|nr:acyl-CoA dehydrogenase [Streptomyces noursei ATCC 11455]
MALPTDDRYLAALVRDRWGTLLSMVNADVTQRYAAGEPLPSWFARAAADAGLTSYALPRHAGGQGAGPRTWGRVLEEIGYLCEDDAVPYTVSMQVGIATALLEAERPEPARRHVHRLADGTALAALAYSEDADPFALATRLRHTAGGFLLTGHKTHVSGAALADLFLTYALDDGGDMVAVIVERDDPGVRCGPTASIGHRTNGPRTLTFEHTALPADRIVAAQDGLGHAQRFLNARRLVAVCGPLGRARALLERCAHRLATTTRYGRPLSQLPNVQGALGRMYISLQAAQATLHHALDRAEAGHCDPLFDPVITAAKHFVVEQIRSIADQAFRVLGGHACYGDPRYGQALRDFTDLVVAAGSQDTLEVLLGATALSACATPARREPTS